MTWLKSPGDKVAKGEPIVVVESDKADMDVESFNEGILGAIVVQVRRAGQGGWRGTRNGRRAWESATGRQRGHGRGHRGATDIREFVCSHTGILAAIVAARVVGAHLERSHGGFKRSGAIPVISSWPALRRGRDCVAAGNVSSWLGRRGYFGQGHQGDHVTSGANSWGACVTINRNSVTRCHGGHKGGGWGS